MTRELSVAVLLPNRNKIQVKINAKSNLHNVLTEELLKAYPDAEGVTFVENLPVRGVGKGNTFQTSVMFRLRENVYTMGHLTIH